VVWVIPVFLMWVRSWGPADPIERLSTYLAEAKAGSVDFAVTSPQYEGTGKGSLVWRKPGEQAFQVVWGPGSAAFVQSPGGAIEIDRIMRVYQEFPGRGTLAAPPSVVTGLPGLAYPLVIQAGGIKAALPPATKFATGPKQTIEGVETDRIEANFTDGQVTVEAQAYVAADGRLVRYREKSQSPGGGREVEWTFSKWNRNPAIDATTFSRSVPDGYVPFALDYPYPPVEVGETAPLGTWTDARTGKPLAVDRLAKGKVVLIGFFDSEEPSKAALGAWGRLSQGFVSVAVVEGSTAAPAAGSAARDKDGAIAKRWRIPGYPFFALVDAEGKVSVLSFGFTAAEEAPLRKALLDAKGG